MPRKFNRENYHRVQDCLKRGMTIGETARVTGFALESVKAVDISMPYKEYSSVPEEKNEVNGGLELEIKAFSERVTKADETMISLIQQVLAQMSKIQETLEFMLGEWRR